MTIYKLPDPPPSAEKPYKPSVFALMRWYWQFWILPWGVMIGGLYILAHFVIKYW